MSLYPISCRLGSLESNKKKPRRGGSLWYSDTIFGGTIWPNLGGRARGWRLIQPIKCVSVQATLKKNSVSGVSGGRICGQSGGRLFIIFFFICKNEVFSRPYFTHPGAPPETEFCLVWPHTVLVPSHDL